MRNAMELKAEREGVEREERRRADTVGIRGDCDETNDEMNLIEMQDCFEEKNPYLYMGKKTMR